MEGVAPRAISGYLSTSVGDPDPQDPHAFGLPVSAGSACFWASRFQNRIHESEVEIRILPFSHKGVQWTEIMLAK
jgi:hypothetical protein